MPLFGLVAIGYLGKKLRILHVTDAEVLNRFVINIALPSFIVDAFLHNKVHVSYLSLPLVIWISNIGIFGLAFVASKLLKLNLKQTGTVLLLSTFGNTGFLGYPMTMALHPDLIPANVILDQIGMSLFLYPVALLLGGGLGRTSDESIAHSIYRFIKSPLMASMVVGLGFKLLPIPAMPHGGPLGPVFVGASHALHALVSAIHLVGLSTIPVILVAIGILLRPSAIGSHLGNVAVIGLFRLIVAPIFGFLVSRYVLGIHDPALLTICVLISGTPPSATATVITGQYEMDGSLGVAAFFALTILSALTIPLMLSILH